MQRPTYPNLPSGSTPAASDWTTLDLSLGTETNTGMKGAGISLGTESTLEVAATHGLPDSGLDCYANLQSIGTVPADKKILLVRTTCATGPTTDPGGNTAFCHTAMAKVSNLQTGTGYYSGFARNFSSVNQAATPNTIGASPSSITALAGGAPFVCLQQYVFDSGTASTGVSHQVYGAPVGVSDIAQNTGNVTGITDVYLGVFLGQKDASPINVVTWGGVVIEYQWI